MGLAINTFCPITPEIDRDNIESWLSVPRYKRYLEIAGGDDRIALDLYLWNTGLAQAVLRDVSFFEIALRNAYDKAISSLWDGQEHWLFDNTSPIRRAILRTNKRGQVNDANRINRNTIDRLKRSLGDNATPDRVISNLTLGFWAHMTDRNHERDLWIPSIHTAWPKGSSRNEINNQIARINNVRNRAAHHEHLFAEKEALSITRQSCMDAKNLFAMLEPEACSYVYGANDNRCSVTDYLADIPIPCQVYV